ncbi:hypothetical protein BN1356_01322 [Streptococcus varani]|uniref:Uncharacterized protein n=1 Tax=Streptococcus varani TaxID=1608583 RepID=A0A0E3WF69_9STRE|nr:hypothetical protein [Streptococcus varani]CQR24978.1 hypothetical protein BN1356_01322 [Streptococcus varani]
MRDEYSRSNVNSVSGNVFYGTTNIIAGDDNNFKENAIEKVATYTPEPIWRSPITMAILSWIGLFISLIGIFPLYKIFEPIINLFTNKSIKMNSNNSGYFVIFAVVILCLVMILWLRSITKRETRYPLFFNYAINGFGRKLTIEKIHTEKCPKCNGEMKYFNKPVEWVDKHYSDGKTKREITKRVPALQCKRNSEHWYGVDPAEDKLR